MGAQQLLDSIPIPLLFVLLAAVAYGIHDVVYRLLVRQERLEPIH